MSVPSDVSCFFSDGGDSVCIKVGISKRDEERESDEDRKREREALLYTYLVLHSYSSKWS